MKPAWRIVRLLWSPGELAAAAVATPTWLACACGMLAGLIIAAAPLHVWARPAGESYADLWEYLAPPMTAHWALAVAAFMATCAAAVFIPTAWPMPKTSNVSERAATRAVLLSPVPLVIPVLAWSACLAIRSAAAPGSGIIAPLPAWAYWPGFQVLGSGWWLLGMLVFLAWVLRHASWRLAQIFSAASKVCPACGYDLSGLHRAAACPECGRARHATT